MKRLLKIAGIILEGIVLLLSAFLIVIASGVLNQWLAVKISYIASQKIDGKVELGNIQGNILSHFYIRKLKVQQNQKDIIALEELELKYNPLSVLIKRLKIEVLGVNGLTVHLKEESDSLWNIQKLVTVNKITAEDPRQSIPWTIDMEKLTIDSLKISISSLDSLPLIPRFIRLDAGLSFFLSQERRELNLTSFRLNTLNPSLKVFRLKFNVVQNDSLVQWSGFDLGLTSTQIRSSGFIPLYQPLFAEIDFSASPLDLEELRYWLPEIHGKPILELQTRNNSNGNDIHFSLTQNSQRLTIDGLIAISHLQPVYRFVLKADSLDGRYWTHRPEMKSNSRARVVVDGKGLDIKENDVEVTAQLSDLRYSRYEVHDLNLSLKKEVGNLSGRVMAKTLFGELISDFYLKQLFDSLQYKAGFHIMHLDLEKLAGSRKLKSDLNFKIFTDGEFYKPDQIKGVFRLSSQNSQLFEQSVTKVKADLSIEGKTFDIKGVDLETPYLHASVRGSGKLFSEKQFSFKLKANNIQKTMEVLGMPSVLFNGKVKGELWGTSDDLDLRLTGQIDEFRNELLEISGVDVNIHSRFSLNGHLNSKGINFTTYAPVPFNLQTLYLKCDLGMAYADVGKYSLENIRLNLEKRGSNLHTALFILSDIGKLDAEANVNDLFTNPSYSISGSITNLNIAQFTNSSAMHSDINIGINANGKGVGMDSLVADIEMLSDSSTIFNQELDDFICHLRLDKNNYTLKGFKFETPSVFARLDGVGNIKRSNNVSFQLHSKKAALPGGVSPPFNINYEGYFETRLTGPADSLLISNQLSLKNLRVGSQGIGRLESDAMFLLQNKAVSGFVDLQMNESQIGGMMLEEICLKSKVLPLRIINSLTFRSSDTLQGKILTEWHGGDNPILFVPEIKLKLFNQIWKGGSDSTFLAFGKDSVSLKNFELSGSESLLRGHGDFTFHGEESLNLTMRNIDLKPISCLRIFPYSFSGIVNGDLKIRGASNSPVVKVGLDILNPRWDQYHFDSLYAKVGYEAESLNLMFGIEDINSPLLSANIRLPVMASLEDKSLEVKKEKPISASVKINQLDVSRFQTAFPFPDTELNGSLSFSLDVENTLDNPFLDGAISLSKGALRNRLAGVYYSNIGLQARINNSLITLDSLSVFSDGFLRMNGFVELYSLLKPRLKEFDFSIVGENFMPVDSKLLKALISTNINLSGTPDRSTFAGNLLIHGSTFNTDLFLKKYERMEVDGSEPLLVEASKRGHVSVHTSVKGEKETPERSKDLFKNMSGQFEVEIPNNTWIKGRNMNFELFGTVKAIKEGEQIDFVGAMNIKRGYYKIYGRRLDFVEGQVTLTGGETINPVFNFRIAYKFRDPENLLRKLTLNVKGRIQNPDIEFFLDDEAIEEKEAISYLLFNKSTNQLDTRETATVRSQSSDIATEIAIGQLAKVVTDALQSSLGLDVIEISGRKGNIAIGKYITNDLFLFYEKTFALDKKDKKIEPEKLSLEYQLLPFLFMQATNQSVNSGFDFIMKWTWK